MMIKRFCDIIGAAFGLVAFSPVFLLIYIGLKLSSHGAAIYKQERIGRGGLPFSISKFRTMVENT